MSDTRDEQHGRELDAAGLGGLLDAVTDPMGHLAEPVPTGTPGAYWPMASTDDDAVDAARDKVVEQAMAALEKLLVVATRPSRYKDAERDLRSRALMLGAVERALADPTAGYLKRLRVERSILLRERVSAGATVEVLAVELGVSRQRVQTLLNNNRSYVSASRQLALEALREEGAAARAERAAARQLAASDRFAERAAQGRVLQARLDGGETREQLMAETGSSRNRIVGLISDAARAAEKVEL